MSGGTFSPRVRRRLEQIAHEVTIFDEHVFRVGGDLPEIAFSGVTLVPGEPLGDPLVTSLADHLYDRYHCKSPSGLAAVERGEDLLAELSRSNPSRAGWDPGWTLMREDDEGSALVAKGGRMRLVSRGERRRDRHGGIELRRKREDSELQRDFYYVFGETLGDRYEGLVGARVYLNLNARAVSEWVGRLTRELNDYGVPFAFKVLRFAGLYWREDAGVIYVPRRHAGFVSSVVVSLAREIGGLGAGVPGFTRRLAPGVGFADDPPGGASFGTSRMTVVAQALVDSWRSHGNGADDRVRLVEERFRSLGLEPERPWLNPRNRDVEVAPTAVPRGAGAATASDDWLVLADGIGNRMVRDAVWDGERCGWLGWFVEPGSPRPAYCSTGGDLYTGSAGVALFLARLARLTGDDRQRAAALGALRHSVGRSQARGWSVGAYAGLGGVLHAAVGVAQALGSEEAMAAVPELVEALGAAQPGERELDILGGRAGAIRALLHAAATLDAGDALEIAARYGDEITDRAVRTDDAWWWETLFGPVKAPLLGYSHGVSGIACALHELGEATATDRWEEAVVGAFRYQASEFDSVERNWPDYRIDMTVEPGPSERSDDGPAERRFMVAWCNGAPGIALALHRLGARTQASTARSQLDDAIAVTRNSLDVHRNGGDSDFSLCHGIAGNADILLQIEESRGGSELRDEVVRAASLGFRHAEAGVWPCGITNAGENPGLLVGLAGIGHFYLRLHDPDVPSPLAL